MSQPEEGVDWTGVDIEMARQILAQGEAALQAQLQLAIASDQRATTAASIFVSMATAVAAAFIAFWDNTQDSSALWGGLTGAAFLLVGGALAAFAARPTDFFIPGNHPRQWYEGRNSVLATMVGGEAEDVQRRIEANDTLMFANQRWLKAGFAAVMIAPLASLLVWHCSR